MQRRMANYQIRPEFEVLPQGRVLLVDDDANDLEHHSALFASGSYEQGERLAERGDFDLVVVGQGGASFRGRTMVERATQSERQVPVVVLADVVDIDLYLEAMRMGALRLPAEARGFRWVSTRSQGDRVLERGLRESGCWTLGEEDRISRRRQRCSSKR